MSMYLSRLFRRIPPSGISSSGGRSSSPFPSPEVCPTSMSIALSAVAGTCSSSAASTTTEGIVVAARPCLCRATSSSSARRVSGARFTLTGRSPSSESTMRTSLGTNDCRVPMDASLSVTCSNGLWLHLGWFYLGTHVFRLGYPRKEEKGI